MAPLKTFANLAKPNLETYLLTNRKLRAMWVRCSVTAQNSHRFHVKRRQSASNPFHLYASLSKQPPQQVSARLVKSSSSPATPPRAPITLFATNSHLLPKIRPTLSYSKVPMCGHPPVRVAAHMSQAVAWQAARRVAVALLRSLATVTVATT